MELKDVAERAWEMVQNSGDREAIGFLAEARELTRLTVGERSGFFRQLSELKVTGNDVYLKESVASILEAFAQSIEQGWVEGISLRRQAEIDVVSDFLDQAQQLLDDKKVHPASPAVLVGAALEEFLRNWVEEQGLPLGGKNRGIDAYATTLRKADLISKQDVKDITSWGGTRNHAAHGEWDQVSDPARVRLMLEGVNLFMRKYGP
ncbi:MAG: hypothetical protein IH968_13760 [Gemmatimonadetes bacterium]|nr:hypothetical protein [Gemmatimonadota bacterium]